MRLGYDLIVLDMELNHPGVDQETIIEIGAVKFLRDGGIHPVTFSALIYHGRPLQPEIVALTGITDEEIAGKGVLFPEAMREFHTWATSESKNILLAAWGGDVPCLIEHCKKYGTPFPFRRKNIEIKSVGVFLNALHQRKIKSDGLGSMLKGWGLKWNNKYGEHHRALPDAHNTALLLQKWFTFQEEEGQKIVKALGKIGIK